MKYLTPSTTIHNNEIFRWKRNYGKRGGVRLTMKGVRRDRHSWIEIVS